MWEEILALLSGNIVEIIVLLLVYFFGGIKDAIVSYAEGRKAEVGESKFFQEKAIVETFVRAAEQIFTLTSGPEKFDYVYTNAIKTLNDKGLDVSKQQVEGLIEEAVALVNKEKNEEVVALEATPLETPPVGQVGNEVK